MREGGTEFAASAFGKTTCSHGSIQEVRGEPPRVGREGGERTGGRVGSGDGGKQG